MDIKLEHGKQDYCLVPLNIRWPVSQKRSDKYSPWLTNVATFANVQHTVVAGLTVRTRAKYSHERDFVPPACQDLVQRGQIEVATYLN